MQRLEAEAGPVDAFGDSALSDVHRHARRKVRGPAASWGTSCKMEWMLCILWNTKTYLPVCARRPVPYLSIHLSTYLSICYPSDYLRCHSAEPFPRYVFANMMIVRTSAFVDDSCI